jgi:hypothetical protein
MAEFVSGNTASELKAICKDGDESTIDLTGCTVKLRWKEAAGVVADRDMTIISAAAGTVKYRFLANELYAPSMAFEIEITDASGNTVSNPHLVAVTVRAAL